jgi:hypothetical protein
MLSKIHADNQNQESLNEEKRKLIWRTSPAVIAMSIFAVLLLTAYYSNSTEENIHVLFEEAKSNRSNPFVMSCGDCPSKIFSMNCRSTSKLFL